MIDWVSQDLGTTAKPIQAHEWCSLLSDAGLTDLVTDLKAVDVKDETRGILQRYGCGGQLGIYGRIIALYFRNSAYRQFLKNLRQKGGVTPKSLDEYFGYGLYVGKKTHKNKVL